MSSVFKQNKALRINLGPLLTAVAFAAFGEIDVSPALSQTSKGATPQTIRERARNHLEAGEYPRVHDLLSQLSQSDADPVRAELFAHQLKSGATRGAVATVLSIQDEDRRRLELARLQDRYYGSGSSLSQSNSNAGTNFDGSFDGISGTSGGRGGITENDFIPLIELITNTISPLRWADQGGSSSIRAYPAGVYVDHEGSLKRIKIDPSKFNSPQRASKPSSSTNNWFNDSGNRNANWNSELRKVSLTRLERVAELQFVLGVPFDEAIMNLAGLTEIKYVFVDPEQGEIVMAGPAGPWHFDSIGRAVNVDSGKPVLQLEDFVVTLRNAFEMDGKFGCTIDPRPESLIAVQNLLQSTKLKGREWKSHLRDALGQQDIVVFGIDPRTHAARVLVEADYHMKLVGMGLEPSVPQVPSYLDRLKLTPDEVSPPTDIVRWWFTTKDTDLASDENLEMFELTGSGVRVLSESELLGQGGRRIHTGKSTGPTQGFARDFTKHFSVLAERYPVYQELQNLFSLALVANLIEQQHLDRRTKRSLAFFKGSKTGGPLSFPLRLAEPPRQVDSVMNERVIEHRKARSTVRTTIVGVSGGVEFDASPLFAKDRMKRLQSNEDLKQVRIIGELESQTWWWD